MLDMLKEKIRDENSLINFLKIPKEISFNENNSQELKHIDEEIYYYLTEEYIKDCDSSKIRNIRNILRDVFYIIKPIIPKATQIKLRKKYLYFQKKSKCPSWPIDLTLYDTYKKGLEIIFKFTNLLEIPYINFWPNKKDFSFILTHGVETREGQNNIFKVKEVEQELGFRSSWYFVPEKYRIDEILVHNLINEGFEVGIHGLKHDGRLFKNKKIFLNRAPKINYYLKKYRCLGFASPSTFRNINFMQNFNIKYDLSFFDSDIFEPQAGGCLSLHPFHLGNFIELPLTMPQDHTLFYLLGERDGSIWVNKMKVIKKLKGMVLLNTHPDYLINNNLIIYKEFLQKMKNESDCWHALAKEVADWWGERAKRSLKKIDEQWKIFPTLEGASIGTLQIKDGELNFSKKSIEYLHK